MARIFKPQYPKMKSVKLADGTKKRVPVTRNGKTVYRESRKWYIEYRNRATDKVERVPGYTDKMATEQLAAQLEATSERQRVGVTKIDPRVMQRPIDEHIDAWLADLKRMKRSPEYTRKVDSRVNRLKRELKWANLASIDGYALTRWLAGQAGMSDRTHCHYVEAVKAFCLWCVDNGRLESNPLQSVRAIDRENIRTVKNRRALTEDELKRLLANVPEYRRLVYLTAALTGLRRKEIRLLQWADLDLDSERPCIRLRAWTTKAKRGDTVAIPAQLVSELRKHRSADSEPGKPVFERMPKISTLHDDLERAGIERTREDADGVKWTVDFHALRTTFGTMAGTRARSVAELMEALRVTDSRLATHNYNDLRLVNNATLANSLPDFTSDPKPEANEALRTGTDDLPVETVTGDISEYISESAATTPDERVQMAMYDHERDEADVIEKPRKPAISGDLRGFSRLPLNCSKLEAGGIEPPSRDNSTEVSTCVVV